MKFFGEWYGYDLGDLTPSARCEVSKILFRRRNGSLKVIGMDLSLNHPAFVQIEGSKVIGQIEFQRNTGFRKARQIIIYVDHFFRRFGRDNYRVAMEGLAFGKFLSIPQAGVISVFKYELERNGIHYGVYSPTMVKKKFSGNARATKADMVKEAVRRGFDVKSHHLADAYAVATISKDNWERGDF